MSWRGYVLFSGHYKAGVADGNCVSFKYFNGKLESIYDGGVREGKKEGTGTLTE